MGSLTVLGMCRGSSPQMRGARLGMRMVFIRVRIIPADAGSTFWDRLGACGRGDHPRRCGEHARVQTERFNQTGSSPQMRGAHRLDVRHFSLAGIIPADAGSTVPVVCPL